MDRLVRPEVINAFTGVAHRNGGPSKNWRTNRVNRIEEAENRKAETKKRELLAVGGGSYARQRDDEKQGHRAKAQNKKEPKHLARKHVKSQQGKNPRAYKDGKRDVSGQVVPVQARPLASRVVRKYSGIAPGSLGVGIGLPVSRGAARATRPVWARFSMVGRVVRAFGLAAPLGGKTNHGASGHQLLVCCGRTISRGNRL